jgi:hypothetical protein
VVALTDAELDELERKATAATPGPWVHLHGEDFELVYGVAIRSEDGHSVAEWDDLPLSPDDADFVAAANPKTVLALVAEIRRLRSAPKSRVQIADNEEVRAGDPLVLYFDDRGRIVARKARPGERTHATAMEDQHIVTQEEADASVIAKR